jgi:hypothetical protein
MQITLTDEMIDMIEKLEMVGEIPHEEWQDTMIKLSAHVSSKYRQEKIRIMALIDTVVGQ